MVTTVQKWGNSQGIRIPKDYLMRLDIQVGDSILIEVADSRTLTLRKASDKLIDRLFAEYQGDCRPDEFSWGEDVGGEIW